MLQIIIQLMEGKFPRFSRWVIPLNFEGFCTFSLALAGFLKSRICHCPPGSFPSHSIKYHLNFGIFPNMLLIIIQLMEGKYHIVSWWEIPLNCEGFCTVSLGLSVFLKSRNCHFPPGFSPSHWVKYYFNSSMFLIKLNINIQLMKGKSLAKKVLGRRNFGSIFKFGLHFFGSTTFIGQQILD